MQNNTPLVSVCCITYNHAPYIRQCLDGFIMQQTNFRYEILIHDDASTDATADIIREYETKYPDVIKPIYQTENQYSQGVRSMNGKFNFPRARGKYIAMCEGDDYWIDPLKLQKQVDIMEADPEIGLVHSEYHTYNTLTKKISRNHWQSCGRTKQEGDVYKNVLLSGDILVEKTGILTCTVCFRSDLLFNNKVLEGSYKLNLLYGDIPLWLSILAHSKAGYVSEATAIRNVLPVSATQGRSFEYYYEFYCEGGKRAYNYFKQFCNITEEEDRLKKLFMNMFTIDLCFRYNKRKDILEKAYNSLPKESRTLEIKLKRLGMQNAMYKLIKMSLRLISAIKRRINKSRQ